VELAGAVLVLADHLPAVVDAERLAAASAGEIQPGEAAVLVEQEPAQLVGGGGGVAVGPVTQIPAGVAVDADDLAAVVDLGGVGGQGAGHVDPGVPAVLVNEEPARDQAVIHVLAHDLAAVVDPGGGDPQGAVAASRGGIATLV
jgi:hypothetical protein